MPSGGDRTGGAAARRGSRIRVGRPPRALPARADRPILGHPRVTGATSVGDDATTEVPMKALVYHGPGNKAWEDVPDATVQDPTDVVVRVETTTIGGTDLHILQGDVAAVTEGRILGHEAVGSVTAVGEAVKGFAVGDRVLVPAITKCGRWEYCQRGRSEERR